MSETPTPTPMQETIERVRAFLSNPRVERIPNDAVLMQATWGHEAGSYGASAKPKVDKVTFGDLRALVDLADPPELRPEDVTDVPTKPEKIEPLP